MNPFFSKILIDLARKRLKDSSTSTVAPPVRLRKVVENIKVEIAHAVKEYIFIVIGVFSAGFGLRGFLLPNHFIDGGATGISLLLSNVVNLQFGFLLVLVNLPFLILSAKTIGKKFSLKSIAAISILALVVEFVQYPIVTDDKLLIAVFGGFFLGLGIGMAMRGGSVIDGTEVLAIYLSRQLGITIGDVLLIFNIIIFAFGAYLLSIEIALYAILTYLVAGKTVDFVVDGVEEYIGVTIISEKHNAIRNMITEKLGRACTIYSGKGGFSKNEVFDKEIIYTIVTRLELPKLTTEIDKIDKKAFTVMGVVKDLKGGMIKKKPLK